MEITVNRGPGDAKSVLGELTIAHPAFHCFTLEPPYRTDGTKPRAIPAATYNVSIRLSPRFQRDMPHVENVPGFSEIMIHWGNFPKDTEGCLLVGASEQMDFVSESRATFAPLFNLIQTAINNGEPVTITYVDQPAAQPTDSSGN
jgi:hypothetical protein